MPGQRWSIAGLSVMILLACAAFIWAAQLPLEPVHTSGQNVTPAYEGWYANKDGSINVMMGYYNRNLRETIDIPVGPNNHVDPGPADQGQPTHFLPGRQWGVFTVTVPKDFAPKKLVWTIVANGKPASVPANMDPVYVVAPFIDATDNTPPFLAFSEAGPFLQGPPRKISETLNAVVDQPITLKVWIADDAKVPPSAAAGGGGGRFGRLPAATVKWVKFRGPGEVKFEKDRPTVEKAEFNAPPVTVFKGVASTTATFSEPGDYILEVVGNDISGDGGRGFQCCWTTAQVKVTVKGASAAK